MNEPDAAEVILQINESRRMFILSVIDVQMEVARELILKEEGYDRICEALKDWQARAQERTS